MAVTGFWPVFKNLKATLDYADNPNKTTAGNNIHIFLNAIITAFIYLKRFRPVISCYFYYSCSYLCISCILLIELIQLPES